MTRYKLRVPGDGDFLYGDAGGTTVVAATRDAARLYLEEDTGEPVPYLHSYIGSCRVIYKRDYDAGDCHDGAEPGDTTVDYCVDDGRELRPHECRVWMLGPPQVSWSMSPIPAEPITADQVPIGAPVYHRRLGSGRTVAPGYTIGRWWWIDVDFGWPHYDPSVRRACKVSTISITQGFGQKGWPPTRYRLEVAGEFVAEGTEWALHTLREARIARLNAEWEAEQDRELQAVMSA